MLRCDLIAERYTVARGNARSAADPALPQPAGAANNRIGGLVMRQQPESRERVQRLTVLSGWRHHPAELDLEVGRTARRERLSRAISSSATLHRGDHKQAPLAVTRKLVAYLLAVDRSRQPFQMRTAEASSPATAA